MALCSTADIEALLQIDVTDDMDPMVVALIELAGGAIEGEVGRSLEAIAYTDVPISALAWRLTLLLPHWPLASIDKIVEAGTELTENTDYLVDLNLGSITRVAQFWDATPGAVLVDYTTLVPTLARAECARLAANAFVAGAGFANRPLQLQGIKQLTIGRWSATAETGTTTRPGINLDDDTIRKLSALKDRLP